MMLMPITTPVVTTMALMPTATMVVVMLVQMPVRRAGPGAKNLRARFAAGLSAPIALRAISTAIPDASASRRSLRAIAWPAARSAHRREPDRHAVQTIRSSHPTLALSASRRRYAPRSSRSSPRLPWPASPRTGLRTNRRTGARTGADTAAGAAGSTARTPAGSARRVLPSGTKRFFIHTQHRGERTWRIVGDADTMTVDEARTRAASLLAAIRNRTDTTTAPEDTRFEAVAEAVFQQHARVWKPETLKVNRIYLRRQILPTFCGQCIADITRRDVQRWFASLRATPVAADRAMPVLSVILKEAELMGLRPDSPFVARERAVDALDREIALTGQFKCCLPDDQPAREMGRRLTMTCGRRRTVRDRVASRIWDAARRGALG